MNNCISKAGEIMKISTFNKANVADAYISKVKKDEPVSKNCMQETKTQGDSLEISKTAQEINKYKAEFKKLPIARAEKVLNLQHSIQQNTYRPSSQEIAKAIIKENRLNELV